MDTPQHPAEPGRSHQGQQPSIPAVSLRTRQEQAPEQKHPEQHPGSIPTAAYQKQRLGRSTRQYHPRRTGQKHPSPTSPRAATSTPTLTPPPSHHEVPMPVTARQRCPRDASPHRSHASIGPKPPLVVADRSHPSRRGRAFCLLSDLSRSPLRVGSCTRDREPPVPNDVPYWTPAKNHLCGKDPMCPMYPLCPCPSPPRSIETAARLLFHTYKTRFIYLPGSP